MPKEFLRKLKALVNETPKDIPFSSIIKILFNKDVLNFNNNEADNQELLGKLSEVANDVCNAVTEAGGISKSRPNEAGNKLEKFVEESLKTVGFSDACSPLGATGKKQTQGYPDLEFTHRDRTIYLEIKSYEKGKENDSFRTFYFSPSETFKVTKDAIHLLLAFETTNINGSRFLGKWKIISLDKLTVNIKYEFQTSNKGLYKIESIMLENKFDFENEG